MASEIVHGVDTMALAERAWHGYGTVVGRNLTYAEALTTAGLDWTARMAPLTAITPNGVAEVDTHRATYRSDTGTVLGVVGADYQPHQPAELLELARLTLDAGADDGHVEVLGSLRGGRTVFITIALPGDVTIAGDVHVPRLVWVTSMDGTIATRAVATFVRAVCMNTIRASFRQARTSWAARHTSSLAGRTDDARRALQLVWKVSDTFRAEVEALTAQTITDRQVGEVLTRDVARRPGRDRPHPRQRRPAPSSDPPHVPVRPPRRRLARHRLRTRPGRLHVGAVGRPPTRPARRAGPGRIVRRHQDQGRHRRRAPRRPRLTRPRDRLRQAPQPAPSVAGADEPDVADLRSGDVCGTGRGSSSPSFLGAKPCGLTPPPRRRGARTGESAIGAGHRPARRDQQPCQRPRHPR